jgi:hypothetical protein
MKQRSVTVPARSQRLDNGSGGSQAGAMLALRRLSSPHPGIGTGLEEPIVSRKGCSGWRGLTTRMTMVSVAAMTVASQLRSGAVLLTTMPRRRRRTAGRRDDRPWGLRFARPNAWAVCAGPTQGRHGDTWAESVIIQISPRPISQAAFIERLERPVFIESLQRATRGPA